MTTTDIGAQVNANLDKLAEAIKAQKTPRSLKAIMREVRNDWKRPYFGAVPYIEALSVLNSPSDMYFADRGEDLILYFLSNAKTWRGDAARRIKAELKAML